MAVILDPMHSEEWTDRAVSGMKSQLSKLDRLFRRVEDQMTTEKGASRS
jgi:hypothetical protein